MSQQIPNEGTALVLKQKLTIPEEEINLHTHNDTIAPRSETEKRTGSNGC